MNSIEVNKNAEGRPVELFYQDIGSGKPVVLIHGWPVTHAMWEYQMLELPNHGMRVIAYDRRGFGHSSKPWEGYDYDSHVGRILNGWWRSGALYVEAWRCARIQGRVRERGNAVSDENS
jgi:pimeloyl-ACP methyl ester carboxylesterase